MVRGFCRHAGDEAVNEPTSEVKRRAVFQWIAAVFINTLKSADVATDYLSDVLPTLQRECKLLENEQGRGRNLGRTTFNEKLSNEAKLVNINI